MTKTGKSKKNAAAVALGKRRGQKLSPAQLSEQGRRAVQARWRRAKGEPEQEKWYGLFALEGPNSPELVKYSKDKTELQERAKIEGRVWLIELLDHDPRSRLTIVPEFEPDLDARLRALQDLQDLDDKKGNGGRP